MGKARLAILIALTLTLSLSTIAHGANESSLELGVEFGYAGTPVIPLLGAWGWQIESSSKSLPEGFTDFTKGIFRGKIDLRYTFSESDLSPYLQGGLGYSYLHKIEKFSYNHLRELHLRGGVEYAFSKNFTGRGDLGLLWAPHSVNPKIEEQFPDRPPIVPLVNLGVVFSLPAK